MTTFRETAIAIVTGSTPPALIDRLAAFIQADRQQTSRAERDRHTAELARVRTAVARAYCILHDCILESGDLHGAVRDTMAALRDLHAELSNPEEVPHGR